MCRFVLWLLLTLAGFNSQYAFAIEKQKGIVFGSGEWSYPDATYDSSMSDQSLRNLVQTGASWIRILVTWYLDSVDSVAIYPNSNESSALFTPTTKQLGHAIDLAHDLGLKVMLSPIVDPNWLLPDNCRAEGPHCPHGGSVWRGQIGRNFNTSEWNIFFSHYQQLIQYCLNVLIQHNVEQFCIGAELLSASNTNPQYWENIINFVRKSGYKGKLTYAFLTYQLLDDALPSWAAQLDYIGIDAYMSLGEKTNASLKDLLVAWIPYVSKLEAQFVKYKKPILITEVGYQSRPDAHRSPSGVLTRDPTDGSCWKEVVDLNEQANCYEALFESLYNKEWFAGVFWWLWRTDPTHGGTCDDDFTPFMKPAEEILTKWYKNESRPNPVNNRLHRFRSGVKSVTQSMAFYEAIPDIRIPRDFDALMMQNSMVFAAGEWSSPEYHYGSNGSFQSLEEVRALGANFVRIMVMGYVDNINSTTIYRANGTTPLRTATDEELTAIIQHARSIGLEVHLAPYIDPNWDLPGNCRGPSCGKVPGTAKETGRGLIGQHFTEKQWTEFFSNYKEWIGGYAKLAALTECRIISVGSELATAFSERQQDWPDIIGHVLSIFRGNVTAAINGNQALKKPYLSWLKELDIIGVEGYFSLDTKSIHPDVDELRNAWQPIVSNLRSLAEELGIPIIFTEVGYQSRNASHLHPASTNASDPIDCSVWEYCVDLKEQANVYEALLESLYPEPWFLGVNWWLWRSDPTHGGTSDYTFTPRGKPAEEVLRKWYNHVPSGS